MAGAPFQLFENWYAEALRNPDIKDASAMALATADRSGRPTVRMVLLKGHDDRGLVFFTNLESPKACDLAQNPRAALCFHWAPLGKQLRVEGPVTPVDDAEADAYFQTRPRLSQLGAWASKQSKPMARLALAAGVALQAAKWGSGKVARPPHWSGFRVQPDRMEFWQEGAYRQHERVLFEKNANGWSGTMLYP
ncbi:MAG: pyridoxamine 5'-phosphate oxidase [Nibricoccus sp.]